MASAAEAFKKDADPNCTKCLGAGYALVSIERTDEDRQAIKDILDDESLTPTQRLRKVRDEYGPIAGMVKCPHCFRGPELN